MTTRIIQGDCREVLKTLEAGSVHCCVTSPPYFGLRDYGHEGQIGLEASPDAFVAQMVEVFRDVRRVLRDDGTMWLNLGDSYNAAGRKGQGSRDKKYKQSTNRASLANTDNCRPSVADLKPKDLIGIPWRVAFALQADGWFLRQDIIWAKPNPMPEPVLDRCTKSHEYMFLLSKSERYYFDAKAIREPAVVKHMPGSNLTDTRETHGAQSGGNSGLRDLRRKYKAEGLPTDRNKRSVWTIPAQSFDGAHFATFPPDLIEPCILAGSPTGGTVLDPFGGAGTTGLVADRHQRNAVLIELNPEYVALAERRIFNDAPLLAAQ